MLGYKEDGSDVIGVYPLLPDGTCRFLVFDFDNHEKDAEKTEFANQNDEWKEEVDALRKMCEQNEIHPLVEDPDQEEVHMYGLSFNKQFLHQRQEILDLCC